MTATRYCSILEAGLLLFLNTIYPDTHRFQQDNDPKHCSRYTKDFLAEKGVCWWKTPAESPDLNPIENIWASLKYFLRHQYKPRDLKSLTEGIRCFWRSLTPAICQRYIGHLHTVMPKVIAVDGAASGYWEHLYWLLCCTCTFLYLCWMIIFITSDKIIFLLMWLSLYFKSFKWHACTLWSLNVCSPSACLACGNFRRWPCNSSSTHALHSP